MAYTDDAVLAKLSALNETHDSIATAAQWIMFHRRHAERTVLLWFQRLKDSPSPKRLNLIYLANEVTQQSKARHKEDFVVAFSPVMAEAIALAYKGAPSEVQAKLRRVVDVWHDRSIFESPIQAAVESRIGELDKARGSSRAGLGGASIFGSDGSASPTNPTTAASTIPAELITLVTPQQNVAKLLMSTQGSVSKADTDYQKIMDGPPPADAVYAARLNGLQKTLAFAEDALSRLVAERQALALALATLHTQAQSALDADRQKLESLQQWRHTVDERKQYVEGRILRGLNGLQSGATANDIHPAAAAAAAAVTASGGGVVVPMASAEPLRPEMEELTPPPMGPDNEVVSGDITASAAAPPNNVDGADVAQTLSRPSGIDILSHLEAVQSINPAAEHDDTSTNGTTTTNGASKRRRLNPEDEVPNLDDGIDADVAATLREDNPAT